MEEDLQADAFKRLYPEQYCDRFLQAGVRLDGRTLGTSRPVDLLYTTISSAAGSATVKLGNTSVLAGVKLTSGRPSDIAEDCGVLSVSVEYANVSSPNSRMQATQESASWLGSALSRICNGVLDRKQLCIKAGQAVWHASLTVYVLDADGAVLDAVILAGVGSLLDTRLPAVTVTKEGRVKKVEGKDGTATALTLQALPVCLTCGVYKGSILTDPTAEEESVLETIVTMVIDEKSNVLGVFKYGGQALAPPQLFHDCLLATQRRHGEVLPLLTPAAGVA